MMNREIKIEIEEIINLSNGNPESILPGLAFASRSSNKKHKVKKESNGLDFQSAPEFEYSDENNSSPETPSENPSFPEHSSDIPSASESPSVPEQSKTVPERKTQVPPYDPFQNCRKRIKFNNYVHHLKAGKYQGIQGERLKFLIQGEKVMSFCQEHGLIAKAVECHCGAQMKIKTYPDREAGWSCTRRRPICRAKQSIIKGTFFEKTKMGVANILRIAYMWVHEYSQISMLHESDASSDTLTKWIRHCESICEPALMYKNEPLGGEDISVEIYESKFVDDECGSRWAFCAIEQYSTKRILIIVEDKTSESIVNLFDMYFLPETVVVSHIWCAMKDLTAEHFRYLTEEKSLTFYDQVEKSSMTEYKVFKKTAKRSPPGANKYNKNEYGPAFFERMYRKSLVYAPDAFLAYCKDIAMIYPPCTKCTKGKSED